MPRTVEHIMETHRLASVLAAASRPIWADRLNLADIWRDEDLTFEQRRDTIVSRIKRMRWYTEQDEHSDLHEVVWHLQDSDEVEDFDYWWDSLYDLADLARVWIATF